jgi:hypothetical protein
VSLQGGVHDTALHLLAAWRSSSYEGVFRLLDTEEEKHTLCFSVSFLAPYYAVYSCRWSRRSNRAEVCFDLADTERPYARRIAEEIEATYGYEPMPPAIGNVVIADVEIPGARDSCSGKGRIYDHLFTITW